MTDTKWKRHPVGENGIHTKMWTKEIPGYQGRLCIEPTLNVPPYSATRVKYGLQRETPSGYEWYAWEYANNVEAAKRALRGYVPIREES